MHYSPKKVAAHVGIPVVLYRALEHGEVLLTDEQARKLASLYNAEPKYFYEAAQQLDLLLTSRIIIKILKAENDRLRTELNKLSD